MKNRKYILCALTLLTATVLFGCDNKTDETQTSVTNTQEQSETQTTEPEDEPGVTALSLMQKYNTAPLNVIDDKYRTFYEVFVYSYCDSNGDGTGDINGLINKLDYINDGDASTDSDLGATGIWLMPIMPSPSYHKYDVADYYSIDSQYGTMEDFERLIKECDDRGINVIIDLVLNHTSSEHPWFKEACDYLRTLGEDEEPDMSVCPYVSYYEFSREQKTNFYNVTGTSWYYRGEFTYTMPDLNLDNEEVRGNIADIAKFWLSKGVSGFRLDAVLYFYEKDTTKNVEFLKWFNDLCKEKYPDTYIVAECWTSSATYEQYYESGIDSLFNFDYSGAEGSIVKAVKHSGVFKSATAYGEALKELNERIGKYDTAIDAPFFTNHDMGRGAGYFYSPGNSYIWTKMAQGLNLLMNGNAFIYYGEELGMSGSGADENKRAPMLWSDTSSEGMCDGPKGYSASSNYPAEDVQDGDGDSILNYVRQVIRLRNTYPSIARGSIEVCECSSDSVLVMKKTYMDETIYMVYNLTKETQTIDLSSLKITLNEEAIGGVLLTTPEDIGLAEGSLTLPRSSVVVIK